MAALCKGCGRVLDPVLTAENMDTHPMCAEFPSLIPRRPERDIAGTGRVLPLRRKGRHPETLTGPGDGQVQIAGAAKAEPKAATRRGQALAALRGFGRDGATFEELGEKLGWSYSHLGPRMRELVTDGWAADTGATRTASTGAEQTVWRAT